MPATASALAALVGAVSIIAAGMAEWSPGDWAAFAGTVLVVGGAFVAGSIKLVAVVTQLIVKFKAEMTAELKKIESATNGNLSKAIETTAKEVRTSTLVNPLDSTAFPSTPEQLEEFGRKLIADALAARGTPPPPSAN